MSQKNRLRLDGLFAIGIRTCYWESDEWGVTGYGNGCCGAFYIKDHDDDGLQTAKFVSKEFFLSVR